MKRIVLLAMLAATAVLAQAPEEPVLLTIDVENAVIYRGTVFDASKLAKDPGPTTSVNQAFTYNYVIGDIVAVNGKPAKGLWTSANYAMPFRQAPQPGQPIADFDLGGTAYCTWTIFTPDGSPVGVITDAGLAAGVAGHTLTGALAGFAGAIGEHRTQTITAVREASTAEDPANRRNLGGGKSKVTFYLYPKIRPAVQLTSNGPAVAHADYSPVTAANPARAGELLILAATGLGPVKPALLPPGTVEFSGPPYQEVNSPVTVIFNGKELPVTNKVGWPGQKALYWVDFQVPSDATQGTATIQLTSGWIPGPAVSIPIGAR